uniref:cofilin-2-like n=1 Tax=Myxine glutinosa TaxID=7769 RepID=UPI00358E3A69
MSGVAVNGEVLECFNNMKLHTARNAANRQKLALFEIKDNEIKLDHKSCIKVEDIGTTVDDVHKTLINTLRNRGSCCFVLYDVEYETTLTKKQDLVLIMWCDDTLPVKNKLVYAASSGVLRNQLRGLKVYMEVQDLDSLIDCVDLAEKLGSDVIRVEGRDVKKSRSA